MNRKIVICDDETHIQRAAEIKLTRAGYDVRCANDGQQALELIRQERPDMLITDLQMPRMDGLELTRRLHEDAGTRNLPVLVLSAKGFEFSHQELAEKYGVVGVLPKPFSPRELVRCIDCVLGGATAGPAA